LVGFTNRVGSQLARKVESFSCNAAYIRVAMN
jgi:hypothetical protein